MFKDKFVEITTQTIPERKHMYTPCGVRFDVEPIENDDGGFSKMLFVFETGEKITIDSEITVDIFHEAYVKYTGREFETIQKPILK